MDDFLHNLRSGKLKQPDRGRRDYTDYKGPQRRAGNERRRTDYYAKVTNENFALIKETLDGLAENQHRIAEAMNAKRKIDARVADALETLVTMLAKKWGYPEHQVAGHAADDAMDTAPENNADQAGGQDHADQKGPQQADATSSKRSDDGVPELLTIIASMRGEGESWEKIARHIDDRGFPTVSGKGKWRGPAIKKFWDTNNRQAGT